MKGSQRDCPTWDNYGILTEFDNLYQAHLAARRSKNTHRDVIRFETDLAAQLCTLQDELASCSYQPWPYTHFTIYEPKERDIYAPTYRDRVVQRCVCDNILMPALQSRLIYDNAACQIGKGTHFALKRVSGFLSQHWHRYGDNGYILKFDIRKYFDNIDHAVLKAQLRRVFRSPQVLTLLDLIIDSYQTTPGKGLPLGNQTSQWFALYYMDPLDRLVKEQLHIRHYSRYMDDAVLIHPSKAYLQECLARLTDTALRRLGLDFNAKTQIFPLSQGVKYLGFHLYVAGAGAIIRRVNAPTKVRMYRCLAAMQRKYALRQVSVGDVHQRVASYVGHLAQGDTYALRSSIMDKFALRRN